MRRAVQIPAVVVLSLVVPAALRPAVAADTLQIERAWVVPNDKVGIDVPLLMTIANTGEADALLRVRCPFANFAERHTVDRGEGAPAMRAVPSIAIPANTTTTFRVDGPHVMLLQTRQRLEDGQRLACSIVFQKAGAKDTEVLVRGAP